MKLARFSMLAVIMGLFSSYALAQDPVVFTDNDGTFTYNASSTTMSLGSVSGNNDGLLTAISGLTAFGINNDAVAYPCSPCLGSLYLTTGALTSGSVGATSGSAMFAAGGVFDATYLDGVIFSGTLGAASWTQTGTKTWTFMATITNGTLTIPLSGGGTMVFDNINGATIQLTDVNSAGRNVYNSKGVLQSIKFQDSGGSSNFAVAPEPGTLGLFGSGLIVVGLFTRRRLLAKAAASASPGPCN
jgi:hypothetical protein